MSKDRNQRRQMKRITQKVDGKTMVTAALLHQSRNEYLTEKDRGILGRAFSVLSDGLEIIKVEPAPGGEFNILYKPKEGYEDAVTDILQEVKVRLAIAAVYGYEVTKPEKVNFIKMGIHAANQFLNNPKLPASIKEIGGAEQYGLVLTRAQQQVFEGILKAFTDTNYKGDRSLDPNAFSRTVHEIDTRHPSYENIDRIPIIRLTQAEIIELSGLPRDRKKEVVGALRVLHETHFNFYWERLKYDKKGKPIKGKNGDWVKEEVHTSGALFYIKSIKEDGIIKYYEISPSAVLLDQVSTDYGGNFFLLLPEKWREPVRQQIGARVSDYTYRFLFYLRMQYERIRRHNRYKKQKRPFEITKTWEEIAEEIKMPESIYKRKKERGEKLVKDAYTAAVKLGYLSKVEMNGNLYKLYLNTGYYPKPEN